MTQRMYIGPTIPGVMKQGAVLLGDLPKGLVEAEGKVPCIKNLVVPIEGATAAVQALKEQGSVEQVSFGRVLDYVRGGTQDEI